MRPTKILLSIALGALGTSTSLLVSGSAAARPASRFAKEQASKPVSQAARSAEDKTADKSPDKLANKMDQPTQAVWPASHAWSSALEDQYSGFIARLGRSVAAGRCKTLSACMRDPEINPLFEPGAEKLRFHADCADVPYILRAYFSYHHDLPFSYAKSMQGHGRDARYYCHSCPSGLATWLDSPTPRQLFEKIGRVVHSGFFRTAPTVENADFYQAAVDRRAVRPGTMFYDPNGHVVVIYELTSDGRLLFFDGHPDGSLTHGVLSNKNVRGGLSQGGGLKNFRPVRYENGWIVQRRNDELPDYGGGSQFDRSRYQVNGRPVDYYAWLKSELAAPQTAASERAEPPPTLH